MSDVQTESTKEWFQRVIRFKSLWVAIVGFIIYTQIGFFTVNPIGAVPEGVTALVSRNCLSEPFFNSLNATYIKMYGTKDPSLFEKVAAIQKAPTERIIVRLPYSEFCDYFSTVSVVDAIEEWSK